MIKLAILEAANVEQELNGQFINYLLSNGSTIFEWFHSGTKLFQTMEMILFKNFWTVFGVVGFSCASLDYTRK